LVTAWTAKILRVERIAQTADRIESLTAHKNPQSALWRRDGVRQGARESHVRRRAATQREEHKW